MNFPGKPKEETAPRKYYEWECEDSAGRVVTIEASRVQFNHSHVCFFKRLDGNIEVLVDALHNDLVRTVREIY